MYDDDDIASRNVAVALQLMRLALPLLDVEGCDLAAARLQQAINEAEAIRD